MLLLFKKGENQHGIPVAKLFFVVAAKWFAFFFHILFSCNSEDISAVFHHLSVCYFNDVKSRSVQNAFI